MGPSKRLRSSLSRAPFLDNGLSERAVRIRRGQQLTIGLQPRHIACLGSRRASRRTPGLIGESLQLRPNQLHVAFDDELSCLVCSDGVFPNAQNDQSRAGDQHDGQHDQGRYPR